ncbi:MAG: hypothetical protein E7607_01905 [Ruminococcaceae bacterium]|nr:hypothetical protein [Oscillospiraceae bacterium]
MKNMKEKTIINRIPLIISFIFLFNPNVSIIDVLPDFIGYILLCCALTKIADINDYLYDALKIFKRMILVDAGKWLAIFWTFNMTVVDQKNSSILLFTFVFSVVELMFLLPAYKKLFEGIIQLGYLIPNNTILSNEKKSGRINKARKRTAFFVISKATLAVLPELADLTNASYDENLGMGVVNIYEYIGIMRLLAFIPMLIIGIIWLINIIKYFNYLHRDEIFMRGISDKYEKEVLPRKGMFIKRNYHSFLLIAIAALCFTVDFRVEYRSVLPDFIAAILFFASFIFIANHTKTKKKSWIISTSAFFYFSVMSTLCEDAFFKEYYYGAIFRNLKAQQLYTILVAVNIIKALAFVAVLIDMYIMLTRMIKMHTGYVSGTHHHSETEAKMIATLQKELQKNLIVAYVFAGLYIVTDILYDIFTPKVIYMGAINFVFAIICICMFARAFFAIKHAVDTKYMLE